MGSDELLVIKLRSRGMGDPLHLRHEAADLIEAQAAEIERLRATLARVREAGDERLDHRRWPWERWT